MRATACRGGHGLVLHDRDWVMVHRFQDLECWQLADQLKKKIYRLLDATSGSSDVRFANQLREAAASATANLAEAFGYYRHGEATKHARIARASLVEAQNHILDGVDRKHWSIERAEPLVQLSDRAIRATTGWMRYLETSDPPPVE
jgi:four helix bundle protein